MICKNCNKEMGYNATFCPECGAKAENVESVQTNQTELNTDQPNVTEDVMLSPAEAAAKAKEDRQNTIIGFVLIVLIIGAIICAFSWLFGSGIEIDYGEFEETDKAELSGFSADYNEDIGYLTIEGTIEAKVDCNACIIVYFEVYNEYDRSVNTCKIETDALSEGEEYSFDDMYNIDSGSDIEKIVITDVIVF